jgi:hypothetical protein
VILARSSSAKSYVALKKSLVFSRSEVVIYAKPSLVLLCPIVEGDCSEEYV